MKTEYIIHYRECPHLGVFGLKLENTGDEYYHVLSGSLLAHDILEHSKVECIGGVADELKAIGASFYIRGQHECYSRTCDSYKSLSHDVEICAEDYINLGWGEDITKTLDIKMSDLDILPHIEAILENIDFYDTFESKACKNNFLEISKKLLYTGYIDAEKRYSMLAQSYHTYDLFKCVEHEVDQLLKEVEDDAGYVHHYTLHIDFDSITCIITPNYH